MKHTATKAIVSIVLLLLFVYLAFSGGLLYFSKTGMMLGVSRYTWRESHAWVALLVCVLLVVHFMLNLPLFLAEWKLMLKGKQASSSPRSGDNNTDTPLPDTGRLLKRFSLVDLMLIAMMAALGIAVKSVITPLVHIITGPLYIPGGVVAGGLYMMFLVLAVSLSAKPGAATLCGFCQGVMVLLIGSAGSHGALSILIYTLTGVSVDVLMGLIRHRGCCVLCCFLGGIAANLAGTLQVNLAFFRLPFVPMVLSLATAALSGGLGGVLAWTLTSRLKQYKVLP